MNRQVALHALKREKGVNGSRMAQGRRNHDNKEQKFAHNYITKSLCLWFTKSVRSRLSGNSFVVIILGSSTQDRRHPGGTAQQRKLEP